MKNIVYTKIHLQILRLQRKKNVVVKTNVLMLVRIYDIGNMLKMQGIGFSFYCTQKAV